MLISGTYILALVYNSSRSTDMQISHNEVLIPRYQANQVKAKEVGGECGTHERGEKIVYKVLVGKHEGK
jgi:hypothetical protein